MSSKNKTAADEPQSLEDVATEPMAEDLANIEAELSSEDEKTPEELIDALLVENQNLMEEKDKAKDKMLRIAAEMENLRRRTDRDVADARKYSISNFARDMLAISDNIDRALSAVSEEEKASENTALASLLEGVEMTGREFVRIYAQHGITKEEPKGERFDANRHQAMYEIPNSTATSGTVMEVVQAGYVFGERVLRPAMVGVARGGPKAAKPETDNANSDE